MIDISKNIARDRFQKWYDRRGSFPHRMVGERYIDFTLRVFLAGFDASDSTPAVSKDEARTAYFRDRDVFDSLGTVFDDGFDAGYGRGISEMRGDVASAEQCSDEQHAKAKKYAGLLREAAVQFRLYERQHRLKAFASVHNPKSNAQQVKDANDKAAVNAEIARRIEEAIGAVTVSLGERERPAPTPPTSAAGVHDHQAVRAVVASILASDAYGGPSPVWDAIGQRVETMIDNALAARDLGGVSF